MSLARGDLLGPYELLALIGVGGMGEVYRARDTRLGREVAVKVLPAALASDSDRLRRFEQEARAASALNHPNILTLYDLGNHEGQPFLVTELLVGRPLRDALATETISVRRAIDWGAQIARGLAAAHEKGIVHRDLKPENVYVCADGRIKILDFGLAKLTVGDERAMGSDVTMPGATATGVVLGTAGYMAPEQVLGERVDPRADLFSLGCVLYELLGGRRAFHGGSTIETLGAILKATPQPLGELRGELGQDLIRLVDRCLEKDAARRFQSAADLAFALEGAAVGPLSQARPAPADHRSSRPLVRWAVGLLALASLATAVTLAWRETRQPARPEFETLTFQRGYVSGARFSADGTSVVFSAAWSGQPHRLFVKQPESADSSPVGPDDAQLLSVARSGELLVLLAPRLRGPFTRIGTLAIQPPAGGAPRPVLESVAAAEWSPDGRGFAAVLDQGSRQVLEYPRGTSLFETSGWLSDLRFAPDGRRLAFLHHAVRENEVSVGVVIDLATRAATTFEPPSPTIDLLGLAWRDDGREVLFGSMHGELISWAPGAAPRTLLRLPGALHLQDVAAGGRLLLAQEERRVGLEVVRPDEGRPRDLSWLAWSVVMDLDRDGQRVLFTEFTGPWTVIGEAALRGTDGSPVLRLGSGFANALSDDGRWAAAIRGSAESRIVLLPTGAGEERELPAGAVAVINNVTFHPDGQRVVFTGREPTGEARLFVQEIAGGEPRTIDSQPVGFGSISVAPDGLRVAATGPDGRIWIHRLDDGTAAPAVGATEGLTVIGWSGDGGSILASNIEGTPVRVFRLDPITGRSEPAQTLQPADSTGLWWISPIRTTPDERTWAYSTFRVLSTLYAVQGVE
jgi:serine/threonine protein kinase